MRLVDSPTRRLPLEVKPRGARKDVRQPPATKDKITKRDASHPVSINPSPSDPTEKFQGGVQSRRAVGHWLASYEFHRAADELPAFMP